MIWWTGALPSLLLLAAFLHAQAAAHEGQPRPNEAAGTWDAGFSVIPPVPITSQGKAEWRVAIRNRADRPINIAISVTITAANDAVEELVQRNVILAAGEQELLSGLISPTDRAGVNAIRYVATDGADRTLSGEQQLVVIDTNSAAAPLCPVAWLEPGAISAGGYEQQRPVEEQDLRTSIDRLHAIGMNCLVIAYAENVVSGGGAFYPSEVFADHPRDPQFDVVGTILDQASKNGQQVILGLGRGPDLWLTWNAWDDPKRMAAGVEISKRTADELWKLYGHMPSFYGWYLSHEANDILRASKHYYNPLVAHLRGLAAEKPVLISPSGTPEVSAEILAKCDADIISYQDAVGPGYIPYTYTYDPEKRLETLHEVYSSYAKAHEGARQHLWSTLELWQMDGPEYGGAYAASFERVRRQIGVEQSYVNVLTAYAALGFLEHPDSTVELGGERAKRLYQDYRNYYCETVQKFGIPTAREKESPCKTSP